MAIIDVGDGSAIGEAIRDGARVELVIREVKVSEALQVAELAGDGTGEIVVTQVQSLQVVDVGQTGGDGALQVAVVDGDGHDVVGEGAPLRGDLGGELQVRQF